MSQRFSLKENEEFYFQCNCKNEKNGPDGTLYITSNRLVWIPIDRNLSDYIIPWGDIKQDQYKTGGDKSKECAIRLTLEIENLVKIFYLGNANKETEQAVLDAKIAIKKGRDLYRSLNTSQNNNTTLNNNVNNNITINNTTTTSSSSPSTTTTTTTKQTKSKQIVSRAHEIEQDKRRKKSLLDSDRSLYRDYQELVLSGIINDDEFWSTRTHLLLKQDCTELLSNKGISSSLLIEKLDLSTLKTKNKMRNESNLISLIKTIELNPSIINEIFALNPIVRTVYNDKVPHEMSEDDFWKAYLLSEYFARDKASLKPQTNETDDIFIRAETEQKLILKQKETHNNSNNKSNTTINTVNNKSKYNNNNNNTNLHEHSHHSKNISDSVAIDTDLTSTFSDYHPPERLEQSDIDKSYHSAVLEKYNKKSTIVIKSQYHDEINDLSSNSQTFIHSSSIDNEGNTGLVGHKRKYGDWSWSGQEYFQELQQENQPEFIPLKLNTNHNFHKSDQNNEQQHQQQNHHHENSHHHHHHHHESNHHNHNHNSNNKNIQKPIHSINPFDITRNLSSIFPSPTQSYAIFKEDLDTLSKQSNSSHSRTSNIPIITHDHSRIEHEDLNLAPDIKQYLFHEYRGVTELLRHFYSIIEHSGLQQHHKIEKILSKLDEKIQNITNKKKWYQSQSQKFNGADLSKIFRCMKDISDLFHRAVAYWDKLQSVKNH